MSSALSLAVSICWLVALGAHATLVVRLLRRRVVRALFALVVPPLAPYWGWRYGLRRAVAVWCIAVVLYAVAVAAAGG